MELAAWLRDIYKLEPVETSDEDTEFDEQATTGTPSGDPSSNDLLRSAHRSEPLTQIIDLGSPSESSSDDDASPFGTLLSTATAANAIGARPVSLRRPSTPDSVIGETVEPDSVIIETVEHVAPDQTLPMRTPTNHGDEPQNASITTVRTPTNHGDEPQNASITTVRRWRWADFKSNV
jgi:hypothetical protein